MFTDLTLVGDPFNNLVLPLTRRYPEIIWFADEKVAATSEGSGNLQQNVGWTQQLAQVRSAEGNMRIQLPKTNGKYIELERMLSSIVFLHFFELGSKEAYDRFTSLQDPKEKLSWESFTELHQFTKTVANTKELFEALEAMLVFSDAGKTPTALEEAKKHGLNQADHDDFIEALFHQKKAIIENILPSFKKLSPSSQDVLIRVTSAMPIHLGHVLHLEGGNGMFAKFANAIQEGKVTEEFLNFAFLINLCDVAAALTHINKEGSLSFTEDTYQGYQLVKEVLLKMIKERLTPKEAHLYYYKLRAEGLGADMNNPEERFLVRIACWIRLGRYAKEDYKALKNAMGQLPKEFVQTALEQFDLERGINSWERNPTYGPTVLLNLAKFQNKEEPKPLKIKRALEGAYCLALWFQAYGLQVMNAKNPVNLNGMAGVAAKSPEKFQLKNFKVEDFKLNEKNVVSFEPKELSTSLDTKETTPLIWTKDKEQSGMQESITSNKQENKRTIA